jgi:hypothetical protein
MINGREEVMGNYILVPLNPSDQTEDLIPRIGEVAQAGMTVIFLIPYRGNGLFKNRRIRAELSTKGMPTDKKTVMQYSYEEQRRLADERLSVACKALHERGVGVIAYVYMGRLGRLLKRYGCNGGVHRVLLRRRNAIPMIGFFRGIVALLSSFKGSNTFPYSYYYREI